MKTKWKVGQKVWDKTVSEEAGEIIEIKLDCIDPIRVRFGDELRLYNPNGSLNFSTFPTLSATPYEIKMEGFSQEVEEEVLPYKGQVCWGKNDDDKRYHIGHFVEKIEEDYILSSDIEGINGKHFDQITTKNPYETDREPQVGDMCYFWDALKKEAINFGELENIKPESPAPFIVKCTDGVLLMYKHCSLKNPLLK